MLQLTTGQVARRFRVTLQTLYHYEAMGLVVPGRSDGKRVYDDSCLERMDLVVRRRRAGLSLPAIAQSMSVGPDSGDRLRA